ncbi:MAG: SDR family NAD(P)-dependent oxidoreductase [Conexibacter sp.]
MKIAAERKALVTGGASGLGLAAAKGLLREGASVALLDVNAQRCETLAEQLGPNAYAAAADVRSPAEVREAVERATAQMGGLDTLVLSAGVIHVKPIADVTESDWDRVLDINLKGAFLTCQAAAPALTASGRGRIVAISSDAGRRGAPLLHAYSASKFGLIGLMESLAGELAPHVTANSVCPVGVASTGMGQQMLSWKVDHTGKSADQVMESIAHNLPLGRPGSEDDITEAVLYFVSEAGSFLTGIALDVDGGARLNTIPGSNA